LGVVALVQKHPNVQFILTHAGMPLQTTDDYVALWRRNLKVLAKFPNVAVKISGFGLADPNWDSKTVKRIGQVVIEMFGVERCMLASNFPVERIHRSYSAIWHAFSIAFGDASASERDALFIGNATRFYRIDTSTIN
jgi:predicted TIM-barrel fold metal-dependent hydrolase